MVATIVSSEGVSTETVLIHTIEVILGCSYITSIFYESEVQEQYSSKRASFFFLFRLRGRGHDFPHTLMSSF